METKKFNHYSLETKLEIVRLYNSGLGCRRISRTLGLTESRVIYWIRRYVEYGDDFLLRGKNKFHPLIFKTSIVRDVLENNLSFEGASIKYHINSSSVRQWVKSVVNEGYEALIGCKRDKPSKHPMKSKSKKASPPLDSTAREKELERQLKDAQMEIEYLKKLRALVQERLQREQSRRPKSSKN